MAMAVHNNVTYICENPYRRSHSAASFLRNPLQNDGSLLLLQLSLISIVSKLIDMCLRPLGLSSIVSQIIGGVLLGPSFLGHDELFASSFFPLRSKMLLETTGIFGLIFFLFAVGVKMDSSSMLSQGRKALTIGLSAFFFSLLLTNPFVLLLQKLFSMDPTLKISLPLIAGVQSLTGFPVVACLLTELKILNTDVGRLALSSSVFSDLVGISITVVVLTFTGKKRVSAFTSFSAILGAVGLFAVIVYIFRPLVRWMLRRRSHDGKPVSHAFIIIIFAFVLFVAFCSELIGQHYVFGPLILGLVVPEGPPLGSALVYKVETLVTGFFYPAYLAGSGLKTNVFTISSQAFWLVAAVVLFAGIIKIAAVMIPAKYFDIPAQEAFVLGLILNVKGIVELMVYNLMKGNERLTDQDFALCIISVILVTAVITPLIKLLYDPSKQFYSLVRRTIQHSKRESELRILLCLHNQDTVPTAMDLLEVSNASEESHVMVIALILTELVGRTTPVLIEHQRHRHLQRTASSTSHILNALRSFERNNEGCAAVESFTSISHYETMHGDICQVARDKRATIVILPFHRNFAIDGSIGSANKNIQSLNIKVLEVAPCSVGILIDRGILNDHISVIITGVTYRIGVLFIGGQDDAESVSYGSRMARHPCVHLTVIRFLLFGAENSNDRERDSQLIEEYRESNFANERFTIVEEVVKDGSGFAASLKDIGDRFDLMIVGMHHLESKILSGLGEWSECPELGVVGDMLASRDCGSRASVLVVQQQRIGGRVVGWNMQKKVHDEEQRIHEVPLFAASTKVTP